jgi:hypothetical protein
VLSDSELFARAGLPDFTVDNGGNGPLSRADYTNALRQYKGGLDTMSDQGLNTVSNTLCYIIKNGGYTHLRDGLKATLKLSPLQALQFSTLVVAQYCPGSADKISG